MPRTNANGQHNWRLSCVNYFRLSTLLPFIVPIPLAPLVVLGIFFPQSPQWFAFLVLVPISGIAMFWIPYTLLVAVLLLLLRRRSWQVHAVAGLLAPCALVPTIAICLWLARRRDIWVTITQVAPNCLLLGYFYVAVAFAGFYIMRKRGHLACE